MKRLSILFVFALITSMASIGIAAPKTTFKADLSPKSEIGTATSSNATGDATFQVSKTGGAAPGGGGGGNAPGPGPSGPVGESYPGIVENPREMTGRAPGGGAYGAEVLHYQLNVANINDVTAAHLHLGKPGTTEGPVIAPLYLGPQKSGEFNGKLASGIITSKDLKGPMSGKTIADLVKEMKAGNVYVNVHTIQNPAGEIRGEVTPS